LTLANPSCGGLGERGCLAYFLPSPNHFKKVERICWVILTEKESKNYI
jgi:hypothetical protein